MHQTISQRRAILEALRQRCSLSSAEFYSKAGRLNPAAPPRFTVIPSGGNQFNIVERNSGTVKQVCVGHGAACQAAQLLEQKTVKKPVDFGTLMLRWTVFFFVIMGLFAFYGAHP